MALCLCLLGLFFFFVSCLLLKPILFFLFFKRVYLFEIEHKRERERARQRQREKQAPAGGLMRDSIPGPRGHILGQSRTLSQLSPPGAPRKPFLQSSSRRRPFLGVLVSVPGRSAASGSARPGCRDRLPSRPPQTMQRSRTSLCFALGTDGSQPSRP